MAKYGMSMTTLGLAEELKEDGIAVNSLWPCTIIDTAAIRNMPGGSQIVKAARSPEIMADAAHAVLTRPSRGTQRATSSPTSRCWARRASPTSAATAWVPRRTGWCRISSSDSCS